MPIPTTATSACTVLPSAMSTTTPSAVVRTASSADPVRRSTPLSRCNRHTASPMAVPMTRASGSGAGSTTVTCTPAAVAVAASSRPMKPAPTMASRRPAVSWGANRVASSSVRR